MLLKSILFFKRKLNFKAKTCTASCESDSFPLACFFFLCLLYNKLIFRDQSTIFFNQKIIVFSHFLLHGVGRQRIGSASAFSSTRFTFLFSGSFAMRTSSFPMTGTRSICLLSRTFALPALLGCRGCFLFRFYFRSCNFRGLHIGL